MDYVPKHKAKGDPLYAEEWNNLTDYATALARGTSGRGVNLTVDPNGVTIRGEKVWTLREPATLAFGLNVGTVDLEPFDACAITEPVQVQADPPPHEGQPLREGIAHGTRVLEVYRPTETSFGRFGICAERIPTDTIGRLWVAGICPAMIARYYEMYAASQYLRKPDRADTMMDAGYLQICEVGAAQVLWVNYPVSAIESPALSVIRFDSRNTNGVGIMETGNENQDGVVEVLRFTNSVVISEIVSGVIRVDMGP